MTTKQRDDGDGRSVTSLITMTRRRRRRLLLLHDDGGDASSSRWNTTVLISMMCCSAFFFFWAATLSSSSSSSPSSFFAYGFTGSKKNNRSIVRNGNRRTQPPTFQNTPSAVPSLKGSYFSPISSFSSSSSSSYSSTTSSVPPDIMSLLSSSSSSSSPWSPGLWLLRLNFFGLGSINDDDDDESDGRRTVRLAVSGVVLVSSNDVKIGTTNTATKDDDINKRLFFGPERTTVSEIRTLTSDECQFLLQHEQFSTNPQTVSILSKQINQQQGRPFAFINQNGQHFLNIEQQRQQQDGGSSGRNGWAIDFPASPSSSSLQLSSSSNSKNGKASTLRICLEVNNNDNNPTSSVIERGGVTILPNHCQLFLTANVWRESSLEAGQRQIVPLWKQAKKAQSELEQQLSHESGDRRLDGVDLVDTISAYSDMASLVWKRDETRSKLQDALRVYPPPPPPQQQSTTDDDDISNDDGTYLPEGIWPGDVEWLSISNGGVDSNPIYMSPVATLTTATVNHDSRKSLNNKNNDVQLVGTWSAEPILPEGVYEEVE